MIQTRYIFFTKADFNDKAALRSPGDKWSGLTKPSPSNAPEGAKPTAIGSTNSKVRDQFEAARRLGKHRAGPDVWLKWDSGGVPERVIEADATHILCPVNNPPAAFKKKGAVKAPGLSGALVLEHVEALKFVREGVLPE